ncbi:MAG TPA: flagellar basal-body rod protein FlgF [Terriglobales bacterium]
MNSGFYAACSGLVARMHQLDLVAHNLANANTTGYRAENVDFRTVLAGRSPMQLVGAGEVNQFSTLSDTRLDFAQGNLKQTGSNSDFAIEGPGFFAVQAQSGVRYTRNGNFRISTAGMLVTQSGAPVLGEQGPVRLPSNDFSVSADGTISCGGALAGKLRIVEFPAGTQFNNFGNSIYDAPKAAAQPAKGSTVRQQMLEDSNVNAVGAAVELISLQRHAEMLNRALNMFHTEMDKTAAEDLPRV